MAAPKSVGEGIDNRSPLASERWGDETKPAFPGSFRLPRRKLRDKLFDRFVPSNFFPLAGAAGAGALERSLDAVGMIGDLQCGVAARAELALTDRMRGISFDLFRQAHFQNAEVAV